MKLRSSLLAFLLLPALCATGCRSSHTAPPATEESVKPGINESFLTADVDVGEMVERFEGESREIAVHRDDILAALDLRSGQDVADVGAGTGLFLGGLSRAVGPEGTVYAVDIAPSFVEHMRERARDEGWSNVEPVLGGERSTKLLARSVDVVFTCDTYHHFEYPRNMLHSIHEALRPGGSLVIVDFERIPGESSEWVLGHVRAGKDTVRAEVEAAGFVFRDEVPIAGLEENYVIRFRRSD